MAAKVKMVPSSLTSLTSLTSLSLLMLFVPSLACTESRHRHTFGLAGPFCAPGYANSTECTLQVKKASMQLIVAQSEAKCNRQALGFGPAFAAISSANAGNLSKCLEYMAIVGITQHRRRDGSICRYYASMPAAGALDTSDVSIDVSNRVIHV